MKNNGGRTLASDRDGAASLLFHRAKKMCSAEKIVDNAPHAIAQAVASHKSDRARRASIEVTFQCDL